MRTLLMGMAAIAAITLTPYAHADPIADQCAAMIAKVEAGRPHFPGEGAMNQQEMQACITSMRAEQQDQQQIAGNEDQIPSDVMNPPPGQPIKPVIPQGPLPANPYRPAFPDA